LQLWKKCIASRYRTRVKKISWGKHYRAGIEIEEGVVSTLEEADSVEIIVGGCKKKPGLIDVGSAIRDEPQVFHVRVKEIATVEEVRNIITLAHKGKPIAKLAFEGAEIAEEDLFSDWMLRTGGEPRQIQAVSSKLVQVILDWRGAEQRMLARETGSISTGILSWWCPLVSSPQTPLWGYSLSSVLRILRVNRLKRGSSPRPKTGNLRKLRQGEKLAHRKSHFRRETLRNQQQLRRNPSSP
jgi:hypothetical protein